MSAAHQKTPAADKHNGNAPDPARDSLGHRDGEPFETVWAEKWLDPSLHHLDLGQAMGASASRDARNH